LIRLSLPKNQPAAFNPDKMGKKSMKKHLYYHEQLKCSHCGWNQQGISSYQQYKPKMATHIMYGIGLGSDSIAV
jgi:hypothetical protein